MSNEIGTINSSGLRHRLRHTRREVLLGGGAALVGLTLRGDALAGLLGQDRDMSFPGVTFSDELKRTA